VFHKGKLLERPIDITPDTSNAEPETAGSEVVPHVYPFASSLKEPNCATGQANQTTPSKSISA
jgi:hypothetical protein